MVELAETAMVREVPLAPEMLLVKHSLLNISAQHNKDKPDGEPLEYTRADIEANLGTPNCQRSSDIVLICLITLLLKQHCFQLSRNDADTEVLFDLLRLFVFKAGAGVGAHPEVCAS